MRLTRRLTLLHSAVLCLVLLGSMRAENSYFEFLMPSGGSAIMQEYRSPNVPASVYDALYNNNVTSSDGGGGFYYGGVVHGRNIASQLSTLVQFVCWPAMNAIVPNAQQIPVFAGKNMVGFTQISEGSSCAIKGYWPQFNPQLWYRFAVRFWQPADGTPGIGYQGFWMKDPATNLWHHLATFQYPFAVTGATGQKGWQENIGQNGVFIMENRRAYHYRNNAWNSASQIRYTRTSDGGPFFASLVDGSSATRIEVRNNATTTNVPVTLTMTQAAQPEFDAIVVSHATATVLGDQLLVQWQVPESSSPPLEHKIEVFDNAAYAGVPVTYTEREPERRARLIALGGNTTPFVRLTVSDIFYRQGAPVDIVPTNPAVSSAVAPAGTVPGLNFSYYEKASGAWTALPDFTTLTASMSGAVDGLDVSPRKRRSNYAFEHSGHITVPETGLYLFTLHSGDGSALIIDGQTVIDFNGLHDSTNHKSGGIALAAGKHTFKVQFFKGDVVPTKTDAYTDGLGLSYEGPGIARSEVPASAYTRTPSAGVPAVALSAPASGASVPTAGLGLVAAVTPNGATINKVQFYMASRASYYKRPGEKTEFLLGEDTTAPYECSAMAWAAANNPIKARVIYNTSSVLDSAPITVTTTNAAAGAWAWSPLEIRNYPGGMDINGGDYSVIGDGVNLLTRPVTGDCTIVARLAAITPDVAGSDGVAPDANWRAGIILRGSLATVIGQPLGSGGATRFAALFSTVNGRTYFQNDTMRAGNGDANLWSANLGGANRWYKIQRVGDIFTSSVSSDGVNWTLVNTVTLPSFGATLHAGVFSHATQSFNSNAHSARFDNVSITGAGVQGAAGVSVSPRATAVLKGLPLTLQAAVVGPVPVSYQWRLNGTDIAGATQPSHTIASMSAAQAGAYTVVVDGVVSSPANVQLSTPAGSGVWTNASGGDWATAANWTSNAIASGADAVADFTTLALTADRSVSLNGARTVGGLVFDDTDAVKNNWTLATGTGGTLTLAASGYTPIVSVAAGTTTFSASVAGTQGLVKEGAGSLVLTGANPFTGSIAVNAGSLEVSAKSGDVPYFVKAGATLRIGYSTGGGYASTNLIVKGSGAAAASGAYFKGGTTYNSSGAIQLEGAPTTLRQYGTGTASIGVFDINTDGLVVKAAASGSASDANIRYVSRGYGMSMRIEAGANSAAGDFIANGPLNVANLGLFKRGAGSLRLNAAATTANLAVVISEGGVLCGIANCLGSSSAITLKSSGRLSTGAFDQTVPSVTCESGGTLELGKGSTLTTAAATLSGALTMVIDRDNTPNAARLALSTGALAFGGSLTVTNESSTALAAGDRFQLFSAASYTGSFTGTTLPALPAGKTWKTDQLAVDGSITVVDAYYLWAVGQGLAPLASKTNDTDGDGLNELCEFALNSNPTNGRTSGKVKEQRTTIAAVPTFTITLPVRTGAVFSGTAGLTSAAIDGVIYRIQGSTDLANWNLALTEVTDATATALQAGLPALDPGWSYRTFRTPGNETKGFLRATISLAP